MSSPDSVRLLERLLGDPGFRASFRRDPEAATRDAGFEDLADEIAEQGPQQPLEPLDVRESRSSVAGVMFAAAIEGLGLFALSEHVLPHLGAEDALAADKPPQDAASGSEPVDPDDLAEIEDDAAAPDVDEPEAEAPDTDDPDTDELDEEEPDEEEPDEEEPDEEEPDEEEPDEDEPDDAEDSDDDSDGDDDADGDDDDSDDDSDGDDDGDIADPDDGGDDDDIDPLPAQEDYPGDSASRDRIGAWMGHQAQKRGLPAELPVMASLVESGMKNLPGGDADSIGFFQMRTGIWNSGDYAGYPERPELQLDWFLDHAEAVKAQRVARGRPGRRSGSLRRVDRGRRASRRAVPRPLPTAARRSA